MRRLVIVVALVFIAADRLVPAQSPALPGRPDSLKFAVIGDTGSGDQSQYEVGRRMAAARLTFPFEMVVMLGDNMYGRQQPQDFLDKFEHPYAALLQAGVRFYATLGNHDDQKNRFYQGFNMGGERYFTYTKKSVRFFVLDTNVLDPMQRSWLDAALSESREDWKICYFHHPIYSDGGRHGSDVSLRVALEPLLVKHGVDVVFAGHDHMYERLKPQKGITYFVAGSGGELRKGDVEPSSMTAAYFDQDQVFMLVEVAGDDLFFQAVSRAGKVVDNGVIRRRAADAKGPQ